MNAHYGPYNTMRNVMPGAPTKRFKTILHKSLNRTIAEHAPISAAKTSARKPTQVPHPATAPLVASTRNPTQVPIPTPPQPAQTTRRPTASNPSPWKQHPDCYTRTAFLSMPESTIKTLDKEERRREAATHDRIAAHAATTKLRSAKEEEELEEHLSELPTWRGCKHDTPEHATTFTIDEVDEVFQANISAEAAPGPNPPPTMCQCLECLKCPEDASCESPTTDASTLYASDCSDSDSDLSDTESDDDDDAEEKEYFFQTEPVNYHAKIEAMNDDLYATSQLILQRAAEEEAADRAAIVAAHQKSRKRIAPVVATKLICVGMPSSTPVQTIIA